MARERRRQQLKASHLTRMPSTRQMTFLEREAEAAAASRQPRTHAVETMKRHKQETCGESSERCERVRRAARRVDISQWQKEASLPSRMSEEMRSSTCREEFRRLPCSGELQLLERGRLGGSEEPGVRSSEGKRRSDRTDMCVSRGFERGRRRGTYVTR